jgi:hypothetical protein
MVTDNMLNSHISPGDLVARERVTIDAHLGL